MFEREIAVLEKELESKRGTRAAHVVQATLDVMHRLAGTPAVPCGKEGCDIDHQMFDALTAAMVASGLVIGAAKRGEARRSIFQDYVVNALAIAQWLDQEAAEMESPITTQKEANA